MKLNRIEVAGIFASLSLVVLAGVFFASQKAYADVDPCTLPGMVMLDCTDAPTSEEAPNSNVEDGEGGNGDSLAEEINCEVYAQLTAQGSPIPGDFDASACGDSDDDDDGGGDDDGTGGDGDGGGDDGDGDGGGGNDGEGGGGGGGSGGTPACSDGFDNDSDGLIDLLDPNCDDIYDNDEAEPASGGSGGGGGGGGGYLATTTATSTGVVSGTATSTPSVACDAYLTSFIKFGAKNDEEQVMRLQHVLKNFEGAAIEENGDYDQATLSAVHAFQMKYWDTILAPWNIKESTGYVYLTTRKKVNEIYCANNVAFPLTAEENKLIEATKVTPTAPSAQKPTTPAAAPAAKGKAEPAAKASTSTKANVGETETSRGGVLDFLRRLFRRGE